MVAQQQGLAHAQVQRVQQTRVHPGLARARNTLGHLLRQTRPLTEPDAATQGIAELDGLERHQLALATLFISGARHGRKAHRARDIQAQAAGLLVKSRCRRPVAAEHHIAAQQLPSIAFQAALEPVSEKPHSGQCGHGQGDGHHQQAQLSCPPVPPGVFQAQGPKIHVHGKEP